jgi:hypothetical protein
MYNVRREKVEGYGLAFECELAFVTSEWSEVSVSQNMSFEVLVSLEAVSAVMTEN